MPELNYMHDVMKGSKLSAPAGDSFLDHLQAPQGPKPKRWKLRLRKKPEVEEKEKKKRKKSRKKKAVTPVPEVEVEEWELGPTLDEMRSAAVEKYYADVRLRLQHLLEYRKMTGVRRPVERDEYLKLFGMLGADTDDISSFSSLTISDINKVCMNNV